MDKVPTPICDAAEQCGFVYDDNGEPVGNGIPAISADLARQLERDRARLIEAAQAASDWLREVGDDYPGSSCQKWCRERAAITEGVLASLEAKP